MRKCLYGWTYGNYNFRTKFSGRQIDLISEALELCNETKPREFHRAIRNLKFLKFWKGTEYRTVLLYVGTVILKDFVAAEVYEHFLLLSCAVTILSCKAYLKYIDIADKLLRKYIEKYIQIYGSDSISSNIHNLCHVVDDVKKFGYLPGISSYQFENLLGYLKCLIRSGNKPLAQISRRVIEHSKLKSQGCSAILFETRMENKINDNTMAAVTGYKKIHVAENFMLCNDNKNNWFMTYDEKIVSMENVRLINNSYIIAGFSIMDKENFFISPLQSSKLNIYKSDGRLNSLSQYKLSEIKCKLFSMNYHDEKVFFPILHTVRESSNT